MPDEPVGTEAAGFAEPDGPHPIAGLNVDAGRWTCTQDQMIDALHRTRQCRWMNDPALAAMAREILAQLPEAGPDQSGEIARLKTERAEMTGQLIMAKEGVFRS
jgi:hypothetical protein